MAKRIAMTNMPQLVAAFHSLVGLAAVLTAAAALYSPHAFGIGEIDAIRTQSLVEMSLGVAIGATYLRRLDHRLRQIQRQHVGRADYPSGAACSESPDLPGDCGPDCLFHPLDQPHWAFWPSSGLSFPFGITL